MLQNEVRCKLTFVQSQKNATSLLKFPAVGNANPGRMVEVANVEFDDPLGRVVHEYLEHLVRKVFSLEDKGKCDGRYVCCLRG
jgi:hypothetical protein